MKPSLDWLLIFVPTAIVIRYVPAIKNDTILFLVCALAIVPLAAWIGRATEHLAAHMGHGIGGLLNATFGNAAELLIGLFALSKGLVGVVKASLTGSIIGNILFVLGMSALLGGLKHQHQRFNVTGVRVSATTLLLATAALIIPTVFHATAQQRPGGWVLKAERHLSIAIGIVLILAYAAVLIFTLKTHAELFAGKGKTDTTGKIWSRSKSILVLCCATAVAAVISEFLVGTIESARQQLGLTTVFVGVIIIAIVGNAAEHWTAILAALKDKMDLAIGVSIGSSLQIALFVAPVLMFASYAFGSPMNFEFSLPEITAVALAVLAVMQISGDGESNWLEGALLLAVYAILVILFFFLPDAQ
jgi:Ca2+:H+ antiporter